MKYFKMVYYTTGGNYETRETLIDERMMRALQEVIKQGGTHIVLDDRVIKTSAIKEIMPADDEVREYEAMGISVKALGVKTAPLLESGKAGGWRKQLGDQNHA